MTNSEIRQLCISHRFLIWFATGDLTFPWKAESDVTRESFKIRLNDFPDEQMYTLLAGKRDIGSFDDWPPNLKRGNVGSDTR